MDGRLWVAGRGIGSGIGIVFYWNQEVQKAEPNRKPLHYGGSGLRRGGKEAAPERDARWQGHLLRRPEKWCLWLKLGLQLGPYKTIQVIDNVT